MKKLLQTWYDAWVSQDKETIKSLLHPAVYGYRFYDGALCLGGETILSHVSNHTLSSVILKDVTQERQALHYHLDITDDAGTHEVVAKAILQDNQLFKLYETIQSDKTRYMVRCAYDGSAFYGYQRQPSDPTVQQEIEQAIADAFQLDEPVSIHASGRTDKGVHAREQVFHVDLNTNVPTAKVAHLIQTRLPDSIHLYEAREVRPTFHSRYDVTSKEYVYKINRRRFDPIQRNYEWFVPNIDVNRLKQDAIAFLGTHDFASFTRSTDKPTVRTIVNVDVATNGDHLWITVEGNGFLRYMVRYMVEALVERNHGMLDVTIEELLAAKDNTILTKMAPANGLYLNRVTYE